MIGLAVGAAIEGMRPIIEMQFADFSTLVSTRLSTRPRRFFGARKCRAQSPCGCPSAHIRSGPFTARVWRRFTRTIPRLVVMTPATVEDAYSMLLEAVGD